MGAAKPLALGLIQFPPDDNADLRKRTRAMLLAWAEIEGFAVAEVFEIGAHGARGAATVAALEALARRTGARTILTSGPINRSGRRALFGRSQLTVLAVPPPARR